MAFLHLSSSFKGLLGEKYYSIYKTWKKTGKDEGQLKWSVKICEMEQRKQVTTTTALQQLLLLMFSPRRST